MEWTAHCGCVMEVRASDGEPTGFVRRCSAHEIAPVEDVAGENRALSVARMALKEMGVREEDIRVEIVGAERIARATGPHGEVVEKSRHSLAEYLAAQRALTKAG